MDFKQKKRNQNNDEKYHFENIKIVREFSKDLILEMKEMVQSIVLFGSNSKNTQNKDSDIDIMIVLDNVSIFVSEELKQAYRIIQNNIINKHSNKIHILTVNLSDLWDMARNGDPLLINILREGIPIFDRNLIETMQYLLEIGKIKPTREAAYNYMARSETLLEETKQHVHNGILDLYYSTIDIIHATLIVEKITPSSPKEMPKIFKEKFKSTKLEKYSKEIEEIYKIAKEIEHTRYTNISGKEFDRLEKNTIKLVKELKKHIQEKIKKADIFEL